MMMLARSIKPRSKCKRLTSIALKRSGFWDRSLYQTTFRTTSKT